MATVISLLRAVNIGRRQVTKEQLVAIHAAAGCLRPQTVIASGNLIFTTRARALHELSRRIEHEFERATGFRSEAVLRTLDELRDAEARNPFAGRAGIEPAKLLVTFLASAPPDAATRAAMAMDVAPDEMQISGREIYTYFPAGMGRSRVPWAKVERALGGIAGTGRNLNTVRKLIAMAEART